MLPRSLRLRTTILALCIVAFIYTVRPLHSRAFLQTEPPTGIALASPEAKKAFIELELSHEVDGDHNLQPLKNLCGKIRWQPGLVWQCLAKGGLGNIRNEILNCVRFAIEAGATGLLMPRIELRNAKDIINLDSNEFRSPAYMFDEEHFVSSLREACPRMHIYPDMRSLPTPFTTPPSFNYRELSKYTEAAAEDRIIARPEKWRRAFDEWMKKNAPGVSAKNVVLVDPGVSLFAMPFSYDHPSFVASFGRVIRFKDELRRLAAAVLYSMSTRYNLDLDVTKTGIQKGTFFGAHLRTEVDARSFTGNIYWPGNWPMYSVQAPAYLSAAVDKGYTLIYVASGDSEETARFSADAALKGIIVTTKERLLAQPGFEAEKAAYDALTFDLRAVVDYLVLLRSGYFMGMRESTFAWCVANRRRVVLGKGEWMSVRTGQDLGVPDGGGEHSECFADELSAMVYPNQSLDEYRWVFQWGMYP